jgi:hypothetical protein
MKIGNVSKLAVALLMLSFWGCHADEAPYTVRIRTNEDFVGLVVIYVSPKGYLPSHQVWDIAVQPNGIAEVGRSPFKEIHTFDFYRGPARIRDVLSKDPPQTPGVSAFLLDSNRNFDKGDTLVIGAYYVGTWADYKAWLIETKFLWNSEAKLVSGLPK